MELTAASLWEWTKLFVRDPRTASKLVKAAKLPIEVSILMIVLAGVLSGAMSGLLDYIVETPDYVFVLADGQTVTFERSGPLTQGVYAVATGLVLAFAIYQVGKRMNGQGTLADIMGVTAVLQLVLTVILVAQTVALLVVPLLGFGLLILGLYVFFRGLGHAVDIGHDYNSLGKSTGVIFLSFFAMVIVVFILAAVFGLGPEGVVE